MPIILHSIVNAFPGGDPMDHAVVMAGGAGTRFWPESRARRSKQFLDLTGGGPMIRETLLRLFPVIPPERVWGVAGVKARPHPTPRAGMGFAWRGRRGGS